MSECLSVLFHPPCISSCRGSQAAEVSTAEEIRWFHRRLGIPRPYGVLESEYLQHGAFAHSHGKTAFIDRGMVIVDSV